MVSAAKAFSKEPPLRPLTDLEAVVEDFKWRYVDRHKTDQVIKYCAEAPSFRLAVARAVEARDALGKHHNHQSKVDIRARRTLGRSIVARKAEVSRIVKGAKRGRFDGFDALHDFIDEIKPYGIGPVTVYDVAVRVGAYLGISPTSVYMHAGVRQGFNVLARVMYWPMGGACLSHAKQYGKVPIALFPSPLDSLRADDVEDILCTYREVFLTWPSND